MFVSFDSILSSCDHALGDGLVPDKEGLHIALNISMTLTLAKIDIHHNPPGLKSSVGEMPCATDNLPSFAHTVGATSGCTSFIQFQYKKGYSHMI